MFDAVVYERDIAVNLLATIALAIDDDDKGTVDECYRAMHRTGPLHDLIAAEKKILTQQLNLM
jgi:hypothetical protein